MKPKDLSDELFSCSIDFLVKSNDPNEMSLLLVQMSNKEIRRYWYNELLLCEDNDLEILQSLWKTVKKVKRIPS
ncbi:hypothetical protein [Viridibacillus arvi]|uniref:hypothetical protein n=1 Tax=Viridibacillus arvi TaxID=263475 RepID=UPI003D2A83EC